MVHHAIDAMHVEKNVCEALVSTLLDIPSKIKYTLKARMDLEEMKLRKDLMHHAIDAMHVEKNVCKALVSTLLDIPSKIKDTLKARMDVEEMKLRKDLHHETPENGSKNIQQLATP
jgi:hypothetical protein